MHPNCVIYAALDPVQIAFLELRELSADRESGLTIVLKSSPVIRSAFIRSLVLNSDYNAASARQAIDTGAADAISIGCPFIANPDLPLRIKRGVPLAAGDAATWYRGVTAGYFDYPPAT